MLLDAFVGLIVSFDCELDFLNGNVSEILGLMFLLSLDSALSSDPLIVVLSVGDIRSSEELGRLFVVLSCLSSSKAEVNTNAKINTRTMNPITAFRHLIYFFATSDSSNIWTEAVSLMESSESVEYLTDVSNGLYIFQTSLISINRK